MSEPKVIKTDDITINGTARVTWPEEQKVIKTDDITINGMATVTWPKEQKEEEKHDDPDES